MRRLVAGTCQADNVFSLVDPSEFYEVDFEAEVHKAFACLLPDYFCGVFSGTYDLDGDRRSADLALVHRNFSHWFVVEVEIETHSLDSHVLPQVRAFKYGRPEDTCVTSFCRAFKDIDRGYAARIVHQLPKGVAVVSNRRNPVWEASLRGLGVDYLTVTVLRTASGRTAYDVEGTLNVVRRSIGFARYSAIDNALVLPKSCGLPEGLLRIEDPYGVPALWTVQTGPHQTWVTKKEGNAPLPSDAHVQVLMLADGTVSLRLSEADWRALRGSI